MSGYRVGLVGDGIRRSLTPPMREREAVHLGLDYRYDVIDLLELGRTAADAPAILREAADAGYAALNVTHPCKQTVLGELDELSDAARRLGAVNLVLFRDGRIIGHNTD